jgi:hypothetical protein
MMSCMRIAQKMEKENGSHGVVYQLQSLHHSILITLPGYLTTLCTAQRMLFSSMLCGKEATVLLIGLWRGMLVKVTVLHVRAKLQVLWLTDEF